MARIPRPIVGVHGEDVDVELPGLLAIRASFLSEGLFDTEAGGDPEEEDLYEVEVTQAGDELLEPIVFSRLTPSLPQGLQDAVEEAWIEPALPIERFALALAWELANAHASNWPAVCEAARVWGSWTVEEILGLAPPEWVPEPLLPEEE